MMSSNQCPSCGSTNVYRESANVYRCGDCFDKLPSASLYDAPPPKVYGTNQKTETFSFTKYKYILIAIVVGWMFLGTIITTVFQWVQSNTSSIQEEETQEITIDPNLNSVDIIPEGEFSLLGEFPDSIGNVYFVGKFTNQSETSLLMPKFTISLFSEDGSSLATCEGYGEKNLVVQNESVSYEVLCNQAPKFHHHEVSVTATSYVGDLSRPELTLTNINLKKVKNKGTILTGKIQNTGTSIANFTRIKCMLVGSNGKTIDYGTYTLEGEDFLPKATQNFSLELFRSKVVPDSFYCETDSVAKETN
ncbi:hypothetical protein EHQ79_04750 [Leptospira jelokensis]|nr:hypothetical protein EHQ79_04750 [Leptospira jelokensis]